MFEIFKKVFLFVRETFGRAIFLYLLAAVLIFYCTDMTRAWNHAVPTILSRYMPSYDYMIAFNRDRRNPDRVKLKEFERYYHKVTEFMPELSDAQGMLGFCYYYGGDTARAIRAYERAIRIYPKCFSFHYNLGFIKFKQHDYAKALTHFKNSLEVDPIENIKFLMSSRIYFPLLPPRRQPHVLAQEVGLHIGEIYRQSYLDLLWSCQQTHDYRDMLYYAQKAITNNILDQGPFYYYAGLASYELKDYTQAVLYLQEALKHKFTYSQTFQALGLSLQALNRPESIVAITAARKMSKEGKVFEPEKERRELVIY